MVRQKRVAPRKRRRAPKRGRATSRVKRQPSPSSLKIFDAEIELVWNRLANECRQFTEGFNSESGTRELDIDASSHTILVKYATLGAELLFQLDRSDRHVSCWLNSGCASFGSCIVDQPP